MLIATSKSLRCEFTKYKIITVHVLYWYTLKTNPLIGLTQKLPRRHNVTIMVVFT